MQKGIINIYYSFLESIGKEKSKLAYLQLSGKLEDYLVKEFIYLICKNSEGQRLALSNVGNKNERKYDIAVLKGSLDKPTITILIEAKYIRNKHRAWNYDAEDEIMTILKSLKSQMGRFESKKHGNFDVRLESRGKHIYGLVIASYAEDSLNDKLISDKSKKVYYNKVLKKAKMLGFRYHDLLKPYFRSIYEDKTVKVLDTFKRTSLRAGLWILNE